MGKELLEENPMDSNWKLFLNDGNVITEKETEYWDNVPHIPITKAVFTLLTGEDLTFENFKKICIAKVGRSSVGGPSAFVGYCITEVKKDSLQYNSIMITSEIPNIKTHNLSELAVPERCFRRGAI
jgi:hypothetical protein